MTTPELLPCPFCGGHASLVSPAMGRPYVCCDDNFCTGPRPSADEAIATWNTRAPLSPAVLAELPEVQALVRQAMAAWQMAYDEPDRDTLDKTEADRISAQWFAHWMRLDHPTDSENMPHHGDCTGENISCLRCISDDVLGSVDAALARAAIREGRG